MRDHNPEIPKWAKRFLNFYCAPELLEEVEGDLYESFLQDERQRGNRYARIQYINNVFRFLNYSTLRGHDKKFPIKLSLDMFSTNIRFLFRRLFKQKLNTALHVTGLTIGLCVCLLIAMFIHHELSFDRYHTLVDRTYRINQIWEGPGDIDRNYGTPAPLADVLRNEIAGIEYVGVAYPLDEDIVEIGSEKRFKQDRIMMADAGLLDIFDFEVLKGDARNALSQPDHALLTESLAQKFFGNEDPIGKTFEFKNLYTVTVAGVIADMPANTHLPASMLLSYFPKEPWLVRNNENWGMTFGASTFIVLEEGVHPGRLARPLREVYDRHLNDASEEPTTAYVELQPLSNVHLDPGVGGGGEWVKAINPVWLWFFGCIGALVLILAGINFINLSLAQSLTRSREVGVRKAVGAGRMQLIGQFFGETAILILVSTLLAIAISGIFLPGINQMIGKNISFAVLFMPGSILAFGVFIVLTVLLTGFYPAWFISRFQPAVAVKTGSNASADRKSGMLRKSLVVFQFGISGSLLIALLIMSGQMRYFHQKNLGFDKENVVAMAVPEPSKNETFKSIIRAMPEVGNVSFAMVAPASTNSWTTSMHERDLNSPDRKQVRIIWADEEYTDLYNLQLVAGRYTQNTDTSSVSSSLPEAEQIPKVMVNQKFVREMQFGTPEEAVGRTFLFGYNNWKAEIVGVIEDFNISSLHQEVQPVLISPLDRFYWTANIKLNPGHNLQDALADIGSGWSRIYPDHIFEYEFVDQTIERYYESESLLYNLFKVFAGLAMLISCLGLWGLASFSAVQRTKEIGIRKVLGASTKGLVALLSKDFLVLVAIAILIAIPVSWYGMEKWLENFAFRIEIQWQFFLISFIIVTLIAILTIGYQSIKTALSDPVRSLRNE